MTRAFSEGEIFFYWKEMESHPYYVGTNYVKDRVITDPKYKNLKQEILYNNDNEVTIRKFNTLIILKSEQFMATGTVKAMEFRSTKASYCAYYGIRKGEPIKIDHIQSIICYTDFSLLSSSFTSTFRKSHPRESIERKEDIKERNSCYYWMSKYLIEAVEGYGDRLINETLYCGMNCPLIMESMNISLISPTSTSTEISVAQNFATIDGVILQFNNPMAADKSSKYTIWNQARLNVSWISRYNEESERLFLHSQQPLELVSIRICPNKKWIKYESFFKVLYYIHSVCNNGTIFAENQTSEQRLLYTKIFNAIWNMDQALPSYIRECYELFKISIKEIILRLDEEGITVDIDYIIKQLLYQNDGCTVYENNEIVSEINNKSNLLQSQFISLFPNLERIRILCGKEDEFWQFSIIYLIKEIIKSRPRNEIYVELRAIWNKDKFKS